MSNENVGHRHRLRERMLKEGLHGFQDHEILELLLYQYIPRHDTNKLAHNLLTKFGSFANVLDASPAQLMSVSGISSTTACNISMLKEVWHRYKRSYAETIQLKNLSDIIQYAKLNIGDYYYEKLVVVYVDFATKFIMEEEFTSNDIHQVCVNPAHIYLSAIRTNAAGVILFHCHVKGLCYPSEQDIRFTEKLYFILASLDVVLLEHVIFNNTDSHYSFYSEGEIKKMADKYKEIFN